jgi:lipopolysaccharide export system protein LptA
MRLGAALAGTAVLAGGLAGCRRRPDPIPINAGQAVKKEPRDRKGEDTASITVQGTGNAFKVQDEKGRQLLEARVEKVDGTFKPGVGLQGPVKLRMAKCRLFQQGKPQLNLDSPEAFWDGERLTTDKTAHAVTADGEMVLDAQKAVWTADTGHLDLETAKVEARKAGKTDFTAEAPKAKVVEKLVTMPAGAAGRNPEGQQLTANHVRWHLDSGKLEANGNVVVLGEGARATGQRLTADTRLQRGRLTGGTRLVLQKRASVARKN